MKVKFFIGSCSDVEKEINEFLKTIDPDDINTVQQNADRFLTVISIWYDDKKEKKELKNEEVEKELQ